MCDTSRIIGLLTLVLVLLGGAVSSWIFGLAWQHGGWLAWLALVGFGAAITFSVTAMASLFAARDALDAFCLCAANIPACAGPCAALRRDIVFLAGLLTVAVAANVAAVFASTAAAVVLFVLALAALGVAIAIIASAVALGNCQSAVAPPMPPPPQSGNPLTNRGRDNI
jgi:hypothetical protein